MSPSNINPSICPRDNLTPDIIVQQYQIIRLLQTIIKKFRLIRNRPFFGYGIGDVQDQLSNCYDSNNFKAKHKQDRIFNSHNFYAHLMLAGGLLPLIMFLWMFWFNTKISFIKQKAKLEDNLTKLNIDLKTNSEKIVKGINILRLGNNPIKITEKDIMKIILK